MHFIYLNLLRNLVFGFNTFDLIFVLCRSTDKKSLCIHIESFNISFVYSHAFCTVIYQDAFINRIVIKFTT